MINRLTWENTVHGVNHRQSVHRSLAKPRDLPHRHCDGKPAGHSLASATQVPGFREPDEAVASSKGPTRCGNTTTT